MLTMAMFQLFIQSIHLVTSDLLERPSYPATLGVCTGTLYTDHNRTNTMILELFYFLISQHWYEYQDHLLPNIVQF